MNQEAKRRQIQYLLSAGKTTSEIRTALGVSRTAIFRVRKMVDETGDVKKRTGSGRKRSKRTKAVVKAVKMKIARNPRRSMNKLAKEHDMSARTMRRLIRDDLGMKSRAVASKQFISERQKLVRLERCRRIISWLKSNGGVVTVFSDEKIFTVDAHISRRNTRYISAAAAADVPSAIRYNKKSKHPASIMVLGVVSSDGQKCPLVYLKSGERMDAARYQQLLQQHVVPWLKENFPEGNYVFQQDGAPVHTATSTQNFLAANLAKFWDRSMWPPSSPDLNPLDFSIWAHLESEACRTSHPNVDALKAAITKAWDSMSPAYIRRVCRSFRSRVGQCVAANGDYFE